MTKFVDDFSEDIWRQTYKDYTDNNVDDTFARVAKAIASVENTPEKQQEWEEKFTDLLTDFKGTSGGRIYANAGTEYGGTTLINCFVAPKDNYDIDSLNSIVKDVNNQALTLKSEGGWGQNFSWIRPRGSFIHGIGVESPGAVKYMEVYDKISEIITSGSGKKSTNSKAKGKIRKGAMMGTMDDSHPDIIEFITAKQQQGRLTKFNVSVNVSDTFMDKLLQIDEMEKSGVIDEEKLAELDKWDLIFPETTFERYKAEWNGNIKEWLAKEYPVKVYNTVPVKYLWNLIMESTYNRAEPGVLFLDRANDMNPLNYGETINSTNPCLTGDTIVAVADGRNGVNIKQLSEESNGLIKFPVYCAVKNKSNNSTGGWKTNIKHAVAFKTGSKEVVEVLLSNGTSFKCTPDHRLASKEGNWVEAQYSEGMQLQNFYTYSNKNTNKSYRHINSITNGYAKQYRMMWEFYNGLYDGKKFNVDHVNGDSTDDFISNLSLITIEEHKLKTLRTGLNNPIHKCNPSHRKLYSARNNIFANATRYKWEQSRIDEALLKFDNIRGIIEREDKNVYNNSPIYVQEIIYSGEIQDVYDLIVEDNHNFYIITETDDEKYLNCSGILVHNCG